MFVGSTEVAIYSTKVLLSAFSTNATNFFLLIISIFLAISKFFAAV